MKTIGKFKITDAFSHKDQKGILIGNLIEGGINTESYRLCRSYVLFS